MASCILLCLMSSQKSIDLDLHCRLQHTRSKSRYISVCSIVFKNSSILHTYYIVGGTYFFVWCCALLLLFQFFLVQRGFWRCSLSMSEECCLQYIFLQHMKFSHNSYLYVLTFVDSTPYSKFFIYLISYRFK